MLTRCASPSLGIAPSPPPAASSLAACRSRIASMISATISVASSAVEQQSDVAACEFLHFRQFSR